MGSSNTLLLLHYAIPFILLPLIILFNKNQLLRMKEKKKLPPSPPKLPIIGNLHQLGKLSHQSLRPLSQKYGDMMLLHLGSTPTLVVSSAEAASQVMKTHDLAFCSRPRWSFFTRILYNGKDVASAPYGDHWRHTRSICVLQLLNNKRVQSFHKFREEQVALMVNNINERIMLSSPTNSSALINMRDVLVTLSNDLIYRVTLGVKRRQRDCTYCGELIGEMTELMGRFSIGDFIPWLAWIDRFNGDVARLEKVIKAFDDFVETVIEDHSSAGKGEESARETKDFVDVLLDLQKGGDTIDRYSIKGLLLDMFGAGTDTSSTTLEWMMSEMLMSPRVMQKLQQEAKEGVKGKKVITENDLKSMVYLKAAIQETLRLHPPATLLAPRESVQDVQINGYDIAAGTMLFTNAWAIGRDPRYWDEPETFCPERFLNFGP